MTERKRQSLKPTPTKITVVPSNRDVTPDTTASPEVGKRPTGKLPPMESKAQGNQDDAHAKTHSGVLPKIESTPHSHPPGEKKEEHKAPETKSASPKPTKAPVPRRNVALGQVVRSPKPDDVVLKRPETIEIVVKYLLGQVELRKFRDLFDHIDVDRTGTIDYDEFFDFIEDRRTPFSDNLFRQIDPKYDGTLDFEHFVHILTSYCMRSRDELLQCTPVGASQGSTWGIVAFDTFDDDASGSLDEVEFTELANMMHEGRPVFAMNFKKALTEFDTHGDGIITFAAFQQINKRYPMVLFPCFRLQDQMQRMSLGINHWLKIHNRYFELLSTEVYRRRHNGAAPPVPTLKKIKLIFGVGTFDVYQPT
ncbi:hypothetical protein ACHHYP_06960 [Achlya hypogyna]|uniref:EF-hand domain-containing protein n=1 Tax=Achlya hypogyna TaxID=1202772 RepID=A0A1V9YRU7_ACHHY|nr:hypothetical protein ACHHYP_06960 [Achlya hypogyna]